MPFPLDEKYLTRAELELGMALPPSYHKSMMAENGGELVMDEGWWLYPILDSSDKKRLSRTCNHVIKETTSLAALPHFPQGGVAIAYDSAGNHLVFLPMNGQLGPAVWSWSHDTGELEKIADDFAALKRFVPVHRQRS